MSATELNNLIGLLTARPQPENPTVGMMRERFAKLGGLLPAPADVRVEKVQAGGVPAELVSAPGGNAGRNILYLHGGGYAIGGPDTHRCLAYNLSKASGARVVLLDYRLAPEHPFPAALEDAVAAYRWLLAQGHAPGHLSIAGDSAGGGLTIATLVSLRDAGLPLPAGAFCSSPWTDLEGTGESMTGKAAVDPMVKKESLGPMVAWYLNGADPRHPLASPLHADLHGLPPLLLHVGSRETLLDDSVRLAERAQQADVPVTLEVGANMVHVWHLFAPILGEGAAATERAGRWLAARMGG